MCCSILRTTLWPGLTSKFSLIARACIFPSSDQRAAESLSVRSEHFRSKEKRAVTSALWCMGSQRALSPAMSWLYPRRVMSTGRTQGQGHRHVGGRRWVLLRRCPGPEVRGRGGAGPRVREQRGASDWVAKCVEDGLLGAEGMRGGRGPSQRTGHRELQKGQAQHWVPCPGLEFSPEGGGEPWRTGEAESGMVTFGVSVSERVVYSPVWGHWGCGAGQTCGPHRARRSHRDKSTEDVSVPGPKLGHLPAVSSGGWCFLGQEKLSSVHRTEPKFWGTHRLE